MRLLFIELLYVSTLVIDFTNAFIVLLSKMEFRRKHICETTHYIAMDINKKK